MKNVKLIIGVLILVMMSFGFFPGCSSAKKGDDGPPARAEQTAPLPAPPKAEKIKKELTIHGHTRVDNYYWLNQRENPKVIDYLKAENEYLKAVMKHTEPLQKKIYDEIVSRIKQDDNSVPFLLNGYYYYARYEKGKEYPIYCRKKGGLENPEEILFNVNQLAEGHKYYNLTGYTRVSPDNKIAAYGVDTVSRRKYTLHFKNLASGEVLPEKIPNTTGGAVWAKDNKTVFYTVKDASLRSYKIFSHKLGTPVDQDKEVYHEKDDTFSAYVSKSDCRKYILIGCYHTLSSEVRYLEADNPGGEFKVIQPRERDLLYSVDAHNGRWIIRTNYNAKNFRLMETPIGKGTKENWKELIGHREDVLLENSTVAKDFLVLQEREKGLRSIRIMSWDKKSDYYIKFNDPAYGVYVGWHPEFDSPVLRYVYNSMTTPRSTYDFDMRTKERKLMKQQEVPGEFKPENYMSERHWATARDGVKVPVSLVYRKGLKKDGNNPLLLYGYGSYGHSMDAGFSQYRLSLLDRGFVFAIAHIRGSQTLGRQWYEDGKLLKKKNTFRDFIDCGEYLVSEKFTNPAKMFAYGGSAGGLLVGAVVNMRPDLFKGVMAGVPFVDVVTTMLDKSIPLTTSEFDEWGNPEKKEYYDYMLSYSPYDQVEAKNYPAMLVTTGLHDSQVQYWEPAKWVAKLRVLKTGKNPLLMETNMDAGHGGISGRFKRIKRTALTYAFVLDLAGIKN
jgi:oligopeptidase B